MKRRVRTIAATALAAALCWPLGGCLSPTLPVPPPDPQPLQEPLARLLPDTKNIHVQGTDALKGALVVMWNQELELGTLDKADESGAYEGVLAVDVSCARPHNHIQLWQTDMQGKNSEIKTYRLPNTLGDVLLPPGNAGCPDAGGADVGVDAGSD